MIDSYLRKTYQTLFIDSWIKKSFFKNISPNLVTVIGCLLGVGSAIFFFYDYMLLATLLLILSGFCDTLDGSIARLFHKESDVGSALDIVLDRIVEFSIVFSLYLKSPLERSLVTIWIMAGILFCMVTFLVVAVFTKNRSSKSFHYSPGFVERTEAFVFFILMNVLPKLYFFIAWSFVTLMFFTAYFRLYQFIKQSDQPSVL
jgi:phosphatidylglycerophosphate synthase